MVKKSKETKYFRPRMGRRATGERAFAKINLTLDVYPPAEDGYHPVKTVMTSVMLWDDITMSHIENEEIRIECNLPYVPKDERNLAYKAARLFFEESGIKAGVLIKIEKHIPVAAGLAGGSTDAAAVLRYLNRYYDYPFDRKKLEELAGRLGADVPYCLEYGTQLGEGRGDVLTKLPPMPELFVVLIKPKFCISTAEAYKAFDRTEVVQRPDNPALVEAYQKKDFAAMERQMINHLEAPAIEAHPEIAKIKEALKQRGALAVLMSGSGPSIYALFDKESSAIKAFSFLKRHWFGAEIFARPLYRPDAKR